MNILIVDDDALVTTALKTILESDESIQVVGIGNDGSEAITLYQELRPDILLMDIRMKQVDGLEAAKKILQSDEQAKILLLTTFADDEYIIKALKIGAKGYLLKQDYSNIIPSLKTVSSGQTVFGSEIVSKIPDLLGRVKQFDYSTYGVNDRELELIKLVADGLNNKEIAEAMFLSEGTVRNYLSSVLEKLDLRDRTQLAVFYYQHS